MSDSQGVTLEQYLERKGGKLAPEWAVRIISAAMEPLARAHKRGIVHTNISPDTVFLTNAGHVQILGPYGAGAPLKAGYAAEERYQPGGTVGPWTDVYGLGCTLYRAVTGCAPPPAVERIEALSIPRDLGIDVEPHLEATLLKAIAVRASDRFQSLGEFQQALNAPLVRAQAAATPATPDTKPMEVTDRFARPAELQPYDIHTAETRYVQLPPLHPPPASGETKAMGAVARPLPVWLAFVISGFLGLGGLTYFLNHRKSSQAIPAIVSFTADRYQIAPGGYAILSWRLSGLADVTIDPGGRTAPSERQLSVSPTETTTYTLNARNQYGIQTQQLTIEVSRSRNVAPPPIPSPKRQSGVRIESFEANPPAVPPGGTTVLSWSVAGTAQVSILPQIGAVQPRGTMRVRLFNTQTVTMTATRADGQSDRRTVVIEVIRGRRRGYRY